MFTPKTRVIILIGCIILGGISFYQGKFFALIVAILFTLINIYGYFRQGTVYLAFRTLKKGDYEKAIEQLKLTRYVKLLSKTQKSYYYFVRGFINMAKGKLNEGKEDFKLSLEKGLRMPNDRALAWANLAFINHRQKNKVKARECLSEAKKHKAKKEVKKEIERLDAAID